MSGAAAPPPAWETDKEQVCARLAGRRGFLKILLKTKDDPFFLRRWIQHHARIAGLRNLVVFDNMSSDPGVLALYRAAPKDLLVVRFAGQPDAVHDVARFPELYAALRRACEYFIFLDTDEFLVHIDEHGWRDGFGLLRFIERNRDIPVFPTTWLHDEAGSDTRFKIGDDLGELSHGLRWGKPVLRAAAPVEGFINHNIQLGKSLFGARPPLNLFTLHMVQLSPAQRIRANMLKLVARNFIGEGESAHDVAARDLSAIEDANVRAYVAEIRRMLETDEARRAAEEPLPPGHLELRPDRTIAWHGEAERARLCGFVANADDLAGRILEIPNPDGAAAPA